VEVLRELADCQRWRTGGDPGGYYPGRNLYQRQVTSTRERFGWGFPYLVQYDSIALSMLIEGESDAGRTDRA
jgi:hypothetical protein